MREINLHHKSRNIWDINLHSDTSLSNGLNHTIPREKGSECFRNVRNALRVTLGIPVPVPYLQKAVEPLIEIMPAFTLFSFLSSSLIHGTDSSTSSGPQQAHCPHCQKEKA